MKRTMIQRTPKGFFDASPGAKSKIGYHINQGENMAADFVSVEQLKKFFYRPDLVQAKFYDDPKVRIAAKKIDVQKILRQNMAPLIRLTSLKDQQVIKTENVPLRGDYFRVGHHGEQPGS
ncbi:hypothetical protein ACQZV8_12335 [Magnetococcales bacterium HHB-1]